MEGGGQVGQDSYGRNGKIGRRKYSTFERGGVRTSQKPSWTPSSSLKILAWQWVQMDLQHGTVKRRLKEKAKQRTNRTSSCKTVQEVY